VTKDESFYNLLYKQEAAVVAPGTSRYSSLSHPQRGFKYKYNIINIFGINYTI